MTKVLRGVVAVSLAAAMIVGVTCNDNFKVKATEVSEEAFVQEPFNFNYVNENVTGSDDLVELDVVSNEDGTFEVVIERADGIKAVANYDNETVKMVTYDRDDNVIAVDDNFFGRDEVAVNQGPTTRGDKIKWEKKIQEVYKNQYWIMEGENKTGKNVDLLRIGFNDTYKQFEGEQIGPFQKEFIRELEDFNGKYKIASTIEKCGGAGLFVLEVALKGLAAVAPGALSDVIKSVTNTLNEKDNVPKNSEEWKEFTENMFRFEESYIRLEKAYVMAMKEEVPEEKQEENKEKPEEPQNQEGTDNQEGADSQENAENQEGTENQEGAENQENTENPEDFQDQILDAPPMTP